MNTCEMVLQADKDGKTYITGSMCYNTIKGFHSKSSGDKWPTSAFEHSGLNHFVHLDSWELFEPEYTMQELFAKIGHKFKIK